MEPWLSAIGNPAHTCAPALPATSSAATAAAKADIVFFISDTSPLWFALPFRGPRTVARRPRKRAEVGRECRPRQRQQRKGRGNAALEETPRQGLGFRTAPPARPG